MITAICYLLKKDGIPSVKATSRYLIFSFFGFFLSLIFGWLSPHTNFQLWSFTRVDFATQILLLVSFIAVFMGLAGFLRYFLKGFRARK
ncbi:MAG: hypothetical protein RIM68_07805 [Arenibacter sp.]